MPTEIDEVERRDPAARDRAPGALEGEGQGLEGAARRDRVRARRAARALGRDEGPLAEREGRDRGDQAGQGGARRGPARGRARRARRRPRARRRAPLRPHPRAREELAEPGGTARASSTPRAATMLTEEVTEEDVAQVVAKWTGIPVSRLLEGEVEKLIHMEERLHERVDRPGRGGRGGLERAAPLTRRALGPEPADRQLPLPRPDRRRQDRARPGPGRVHVRLRAGDDPDRHVRVHGEALRRAADRRPARLRRLRGGRPAHRGSPPPPLRRRSSSTRSRRPTPTSSTSCSRSWTTAASPTARAASVDFTNTILIMTSNVGSASTSRASASTSAIRDRIEDGADEDLQARVPQPDRRRRDLPPPLARRHLAHRRAPGRPARAPDRASAGSRSSSPTTPAPCSATSATTRPTAPAR